MLITGETFDFIYPRTVPLVLFQLIVATTKGYTLLIGIIHYRAIGI